MFNTGIVVALRSVTNLIRSRVKRSGSLSLGENDGFYSPADDVSLYRSGFNIAWLSDLKIEPLVIFDVGSYDGGDGVRFKQAFPNADVFSFEADPDRFQIVSQSTRFGIDAVNAAVTSVDGKSRWFQAKDHLTNGGNIGGQGSIYLQNEALNQKFPFIEQNHSPITVPSIRLDSFCKSKKISEVDLLHVDVQGAEYEVVSGLGKLRPKLIYLETDAQDGAGWIGAKDTNQIDLLLKNLGFSLAADFVSDRLYIHSSALAV